MTRPLFATLLALVLTAPPAHGQSPFTPLPPTPPPTTEDPQAPSQPTNPNDTGLDSWQVIAMLAGGVVLIIGIGYAIVADARRRAPVRQQVPETGSQAPDPHRERAKHRARRKQKQARAQRRRNR